MGLWDSGGGAKKPSGGGGVKLGTIPGDVGRMFSAVLPQNWARLGRDLAKEVTKVKDLPGAGAAIARQATPYSAKRPTSQRLRDVEAIEQGIPFLGSLLGTYQRAVLPGKTGAEQRALLKAHPALPLADIASIGAPALRGTRLAAVATPIRSTLKAGARATARTFPAQAVRVIEAAAPLTSKLPSARGAQASKALHVAGRVMARELDETQGPYADVLTGLGKAERNTLKRHLFTGTPPAPDSPLTGAYDAYRKRQAELTAEAPFRRIPEEGLDLLVDRVVARRGKAIAGVVGADVAKGMIAALRAGADNPYPTLTKPWNDLQKTLRQAVSSENVKWRLDPEHGELFSPKQATKIRQARKQVEKGLIHPDVYTALLAKATPARFRTHPVMQALEQAEQSLKERVRLEPGFGRGAYRKALAEVQESLGARHWMDLKEAGVDPAFVHRKSLIPGTEARAPGAKVSGYQPGVLKTSAKLADQYLDDPVAMLSDQEYQLANQTIFAKTIADVYRATGGKTYDEVVDTYMTQGFTEAQAQRLVQAEWRGFDLSGTTSAPKPRAPLVHRSVAEAMDAYLTPLRRGTGMMDKVLGAWMVPILWLSPRFHVHNIIGGATMSALESSPLAVARYWRKALRMAKTGDLPAEIPTGAVTTPVYRQLFDPKMAEAEGKGLAGVLKRSGHNVVESSKRFNELADGMYRGIVYIHRLEKGRKKGLTKGRAEKEAIDAASNVMQNWDALSPIERQVFQRLFPFWGWKRTQMRWFWRYPADHPARMAFMRWAAAPHLDDEEKEGLPQDFENLLPVGARKGSKQLFLSGRGANPFADFSNLFTLRGFISALDPGKQAVLEAAGVDTMLGGAPSGYSDAALDPQTGRLVRRPAPGKVLDIVPQLTALLQAGGVVKGVSAPADDTQAGWLRWSRRYWSKLGLPFPPTERDLDEAREQYQRNKDIADRVAQQDAARTAGEKASDGGLWK